MDAIILLPIISGFGLLFWADMVKEEHPMLTLMLQFMFIPLTFLSVQLGVEQVAISYASDSAMVETLTNVSYYIGWLMFGIGAYYAFVIMGKARDIVIQKRSDKQDKMYGDD